MQTILIVDDEPDIREILSFNLEQAGYACLTACDGKQALAQLSQHGAELVLLDVMMPEMSGFELAQQIRNEAPWHRITKRAHTYAVGHPPMSGKQGATEAGLRHGLGHASS